MVLNVTPGIGFLQIPSSARRGMTSWQIKKKDFATLRARSREPQLLLFTGRRTITFYQNVSVQIEVTSHNLNPGPTPGNQPASYVFPASEFRYIQSRILLA